MNLGMMKDLVDTNLYEVYTIYPDGNDLKFTAQQMGINVLTIPGLTQEKFEHMKFIMT